MSKMSQLHAELSEQANELGFETIQDAVNSGYIVDYDKGKLVKYGLGYSETVEYLTKEQEKAHEAWLKRKEKTLKELRDLQEILETLADGEPHEVSSYWADTIWGAINFIEEGKM